MKLSTKTIMATTIGIASLASCSQANNEEIVEKPNLKVVDGKFTPEILEGLGQMYTADERFTESIDAAGGKGTADFVSRAIAVYCKK